MKPSINSLASFCRQPVATIIFLDNKNSKTRPIYVNNYKWLGKLNYIKFVSSLSLNIRNLRLLDFGSFVKLKYLGTLKPASKDLQ